MDIGMADREGSPERGRGGGRSGRWVRRAVAALVAFTALAAGTTEAQETRTVVLRDARAVSSDLAERADDFLVSSLRADAGLTHVEVAPLPLSEIELAAGCEGLSPRCMRRIASTLDADVIVVRRMDGSGDETILTLVSQDVGSREKPALTQIPLDEEGNGLEEDVRKAVRTLYGLPAPAVAEPSREREQDAVGGPKSPTPESTDTPAGSNESRRGLELAGWATTFTAAALLVSSVFTGVAAKRAEDEYHDAELLTPVDVDEALADLGRARSLSTATHVLLGVGAGLAAAGAGLLVYHHIATRSGEEPSGPQLGAGPLAGGAMVSVSGSWGLR